LNKTSSVYGIEKHNSLLYVKLLNPTELLSEFAELDLSNLKAFTSNLEKNALGT
jgi:hypothetical protein